MITARQVTQNISHNLFMSSALKYHIHKLLHPCKHCGDAANFRFSRLDAKPLTGDWGLYPSTQHYSSLPSAVILSYSNML
jgi:hypothetical protein